MRLCKLLLGALSAVWLWHGAAWAQDAGAPANNNATYSVVSIAADSENGVGYAIAKGTDCLIITARHVVYGGSTASNASPAGTITVTDANKLSATTNTILQDDVTADLAVLQITPPANFTCRSAWQDGNSLAAALDTAMTDDTRKFFIVSLTADGKSSSPGTVSLVNAQTFTLQANVSRGNSGSPVVYNGNTLAGILLSTSLDKKAPARGKTTAKDRRGAGVRDAARRGSAPGLYQQPDQGPGQDSRHHRHDAAHDHRRPAERHRHRLGAVLFRDPAEDQPDLPVASGYRWRRHHHQFRRRRLRVPGQAGPGGDEGKEIPVQARQGVGAGAQRHQGPERAGPGSQFGR
ncbi:MAG: trypsin-like peptidase domain-containing protein [Asticcacaulis sp.]